jgi:very-short-patch-repair endonuclease
MRVDAVDAVRGLGGRARWAELRAGVSRRALDRAVAQQRLVRVAGVYSLPESDRSLVVARQLRGIVSHRSAAEHHGFAVPPLPDGELASHAVALRPKARRTNLPTDVRAYYCALAEDDIDGRVLTKVATVAFCLRDLTSREALSIGDSAVRQGVPPHEIRSRVRELRGRGAARARARVELLDGRAANAFESCARTILLEAGLLGFEPQVTIRYRGQFVGIVDLAHRRLRVVIECDGFETHGSLQAMTNDCTRHTNLTAAGWRTLRFTWYQVNFCPEWVLERIVDTLLWAAGELEREEFTDSSRSIASTMLTGAGRRG